SVLQNIELRNSAVSRVNATRAQVERQKKMFELGSSNKSRYLQLKAQLAGEELTLINAKNALLQAYLELWLLIEVKPDTSQKIAAIDTKDLQVADEPKTIDMIFDEFVEKSPDVRANAMRFKASEIQTNIARGGRTPRLTLNASANSFFTTQSQMGFGDTTLRIVPTGTFADNSGTFLPVYATIPGYKEFKTTPFSDQFDRNLGTNVGLNLAIPIFNGWSVKNNVERNKVNLEKSKIALEQQELDLQRNVYTAFTDAKGALKTHESAVVALESRQEAFNYAKERYAVGMMNSFDFNQAQTLLTNAQSEVIRTKYDYIFKIKILEFYFGIPILKN
ncbi:MAG: TolC family protein, partial [Flavobacterium sp.]